MTFQEFILDVDLPVKQAFHILYEKVYFSSLHRES